jgi:NTE family protein
VATDLSTGEPVIMRAGDLPTAMRASMSAPGVFSPVERDGRVLVDGGIAENLPIDVAREMNVDVLIVVDVGFPLYARSKLGSATTISNQMLAILIRRDSQRQLATLTPRDVLVSPDLGDASSFDFGIVQRAIAAGEQAARVALPRLQELAVDEQTYRAYTARRDARESPPPRIDFVRIDPDSHRYEVALHQLFDGLIGKPLDAPEVGRRITDFYGRGNLETLDYRLTHEDDRYGLELEARRNSWGPNYVRFGLSLQDDFQGNATYNAAARFVLSELTSTGGEWVWNLQIGVSPLIETEFYLPLSQSSPYFLMPHVQYSARNIPLVNPDQQETAEYRLSELEYGLDFGREFGNWGEARVGLLHEEGSSHVRIGDPTLPTAPFSASGYFVRFSYDHLDSVTFPRNGQLATLQFTSETDEIGPNRQVDQVTFNWLAAHSFGRETAVFWASAGASLNKLELSDIRLLFPLGGLFNLSGLAVDSLQGPNFGIGRLLFYRKVGRGGEGLFDFPAYVGFSLEAGNVWQDRADIHWDTMRKDASVFLGLDTLVGPLYIATGFDQSGRQAFYLYLGRTF